MLALALPLVVGVLGSARRAEGRFLSARSLLGEPAIARVAVSPDGSFIAAQAFHQGIHGILIQTVRDGVSEPVFSRDEPFSFGWVDDQRLLVSLDGGDVLIVELELDEWYGVHAQERKVNAKGSVVDYLPRVPDRVLWGTRDRSGSRLYRAPLAELVAPSGRRNERWGYIRRPIDDDHEVASIGDPVARWLVDRDGVARGALVVEDDDPLEVALLYRDRADDGFDTIGSWEGDDFPVPVGMTPDGRDVLVLSGEGRGTRALRRYRVDEERLGEVLWSDPRYDPVDVVWDYQGSEVIAVVYEEAGLRRYHPLGDRASLDRSWLEERFPESNLRLTSRTSDRRFATMLVTGPVNPGVHYFVDQEERKLIEVGVARPWIDPADLAPVQVLKTTSDDGLEIESFFTLPRDFEGERPPLVVMPHGGPIGVRDNRDFDPFVQYLAAAGFAVLQTNYRGSYGRGAGFEDAGRFGWGSVIEDDIESAVDRVVAEGRVDAERICIFGWSYGGYSALIGTTRRPQRYRCAAAVAAPTDLLLMFDSSDFAATEEGRRGFAEIVGDPDTDRERLISISPAYRAADMEVPILLVHGARDRRVDVEHGYRMRAMLEARGRPVQWVLVDDMDHSGTPKQAAYVLSRVRHFLKEHLDLPPEPIASPARPTGDAHSARR